MSVTIEISTSTSPICVTRLAGPDTLADRRRIQLVIDDFDPATGVRDLSLQEARELAKALLELTGPSGA